MMQDMEVSLLRLNALRELGVKLAIDDFGTGYSSLNYIRSLPVDILKIDRSFLADPNPEVEQLTSAIIQLARIFNLKAVAEGVETPDQVARLQGIGCEFGQGFHFAKPLFGEEIMAMAAGEPGRRADGPRPGAARSGLAGGRESRAPARPAGRRPAGRRPARSSQQGGVAAGAHDHVVRRVTRRAARPWRVPK